ncbi:MAG: 50S ribosomal protein L11 [Dehalococcoidia bacterium]|nr:50S ribosomal protein L11 [Dehalococcoidia bacterium]|tara:strand:+ start:230 stop:691 length:462 start_codon:yes stop_codon:yes gene_type:complete
MAKRVKAIVKLQIPGGQATPAPPVGTALGQHGVNIMSFVKEYNAKTANQQDSIVPVVLTIYEDTSFTFVTKTPPASSLIKKAAKVEKGSPNSLQESAGSISKKGIREIAELKMKDLNATSVDQAEKIIAGTARSMGISIGDGLENQEPEPDNE